MAGTVNLNFGVSRLGAFGVLGGGEICFFGVRGNGVQGGRGAARLAPGALGRAVDGDSSLLAVFSFMQEFGGVEKQVEPSAE
jgi:hypothetical protein